MSRGGTSQAAITGDTVAAMAVQFHHIWLPQDECEAIARMLNDMRRGLDSVAPVIGWTDEPADFLSVIEEVGEPEHE